MKLFKGKDVSVGTPAHRFVECFPYSWFRSFGRTKLRLLSSFRCEGELLRLRMDSMSARSLIV